MLEEIVGEIYDEYDEEEELIKKIGEDEFLIRGTTRIRDIAKEVDLGLIQGDYDTVAGFMIDHFGRLPKTGERFKHNDKLYIVEHADKKHIISIRVKSITK
jgi:CBS domain containing-hemolysin-like protein